MVRHRFILPDGQSDANGAVIPPEQVLAKFGPVCRVELSICPSDEAECKSRKITIPPPIVGCAIIDSGSDASVIDTSKARDVLNLHKVGSVCRRAG